MRVLSTRAWCPYVDSSGPYVDSSSPPPAVALASASASAMPTRPRPDVSRRSLCRRGGVVPGETLASFRDPGLITRGIQVCGVTRFALAATGGRIICQTRRGQHGGEHGGSALAPVEVRARSPRRYSLVAAHARAPPAQGGHAATRRFLGGSVLPRAHVEPLVAAAGRIRARGARMPRVPAP